MAAPGARSQGRRRRDDRTIPLAVPDEVRSASRVGGALQVRRADQAPPDDRPTRRFGGVPQNVRPWPANGPRTLVDKIWDDHVVAEEHGAPSVLAIDLHLVHEVTSPQAFTGLRRAG